MSPSEYMLKHAMNDLWNAAENDCKRIKGIKKSFRASWIKPKEKLVKSDHGQQVSPHWYGFNTFEKELCMSRPFERITQDVPTSSAAQAN